MAVLVDYTPPRHACLYAHACSTYTLIEKIHTNTC